VGNRLTRERLDFVYHFAFPPSHAGLLPVRSALKEERAYETQLKEEDKDPSGFGTGGSDDETDALGQIV
jgi:hypothetical protein